MKTSKFVSQKSSVGTMLCIKAHDLSLEQCEDIRGILTNAYMPSDDYQLRHPTGAFLQGYVEPREGKDDGWVLVEFWSTDTAAIQTYIDHINDQLELK